jgi:hypothetical protein
MNPIGSMRSRRCVSDAANRTVFPSTADSSPHPPDAIDPSPTPKQHRDRSAVTTREKPITRFASDVEFPAPPLDEKHPVRCRTGTDCNPLKVVSGDLDQHVPVPSRSLSSPSRQGDVDLGQGFQARALSSWMWCTSSRGCPMERLPATM